MDKNSSFFIFKNHSLNILILIVRHNQLKNYNHSSQFHLI